MFFFFFYSLFWIIVGFPRWYNVKESAWQRRRHKKCGFDSWVRRIPWSRTWQLILVFLPGKCHGQRSLVGACKESDMTQQLNNSNNSWLTTSCYFQVYNKWFNYTYTCILFQIHFKIQWHVYIFYFLNLSVTNNTTLVNSVLLKTSFHYAFLLLQYLLVFSINSYS